MEFDEFLKEALPPLGYRWRPHRRRAVRRKIQDRMRQVHFCSFEDYLYFLQESRDEQKQLKQLLPITVSRFFRNHEYYDFLRNEIFPDLLKRSPQTINVLSIGAAAGEEPYSVAITWDHWFASRQPDVELVIRATDTDDHIIERGKTAIYEKSSLKELPQALVQKYFQATDHQYRFDSTIKHQVEWLKHDIRIEPPFSNNDIIFCCYCVFTYFSKQIQNELIVRLAHSLTPNGYLILGRKDEFPKYGFHYFKPASSRLKVFIRL